MMRLTTIDDDDKLFRPKSEEAKTNVEEKWPQIHIKAPMSTNINFTMLSSWFW